MKHEHPRRQKLSFGLATYSCATLAFLALADLSNAQETVRSKVRPGQMGGGGVASSTWDYLKSHAEDASGSTEANQTTDAVLNGEKVDLSNTLKKSGDAVDTECKSKSDGLCKNIDGAKQAFAAASRMTGIPGIVLVCTAKLESAMGSNAVKNPNSTAKGLGQFIDGTAEQVEKKMTTDANWKELWNKYKKALAKDIPNVPEFTKANIQSEDVTSTYPTSIFAIAILARDGISEEAEKVLQKEPKHLLEFLAMVHLQGSEKAKEFMNKGFDVTKLGLKPKQLKEAQDRLKLMNDCANRSGAALTS
jgi:hypothetical protein